jgi:transposase-like protein
MLEETKQEIVNLYVSEEIHTMTKLAEVFSCSLGTVRNLLIARQVPIRTQSEVKRKGDIDSADKARFWSKVDIREQEDACWLWLASVGRKGYGRFGFRGEALYAHRFAWNLTFGKVPERTRILHKCGNCLCCNPKHLIAVSYPKKPPTVLKEKDVLKIRELLKQGVRQKEIAKKFGTTQQNISKINSRHTWREIK